MYWKSPKIKKQKKENHCLDQNTKHCECYVTRIKSWIESEVTEAPWLSFYCVVHKVTPVFISILMLQLIQIIWLWIEPLLFLCIGLKVNFLCVTEPEQLYRPLKSSDKLEKQLFFVGFLPSVTKKDNCSSECEIFWASLTPGLKMLKVWNRSSHIIITYTSCQMLVEQASHVEVLSSWIWAPTRFLLSLKLFHQ